MQRDCHGIISRNNGKRNKKTIRIILSVILKTQNDYKTNGLLDCVSVSCGNWESKSFYRWVKRIPIGKEHISQEKKGQNPWEWFWYKRFRKNLPREVTVYYYIILAVCPLAEGIGILLQFLMPQCSASICRWTLLAVVLAEGIETLLLGLLFKYKGGEGYHYELWYPKIKGTPPKRRRKYRPRATPTELLCRLRG